MKTRNHGPEPMQTDSGLYSEAGAPADEGPQRSTDAGGPYAAEEIEELRQLRSRNSASVVRLDRMLATLDERTRERDEARVTIAEACDLVGDGGDGTLFGRCESLLLEAASLREEVARLRAGWDAAERRLYDAEAWVRTLDDEGWRSFLKDSTVRAKGWRRIRRAGEVDRG